jgi:23S rRNA (uracil1939-C5)-methyltransferase
VEAAVEDAKQSALRNGITNASFQAMDVSDFLKRFPLREKIDVVVVDPPRPGMTPKSIVKVSLLTQNCSQKLL